MMAKDKYPTKAIPAAFLKECYRYDPNSGKVFYIRRPSSHFTRKHHKTRWDKKVGEEVGKDFGKGYLRARIWYQKKAYNFSVARLAYILMTGHHPLWEIDHINKNRKDNRWENLRDVPRWINAVNKDKRPNTSSKYIGVSFHKGKKKWKAALKHNGSYQVIECKTEVEAARAYNKMALKARGQYAYMNEIELPDRS